MAQTIKLKRSNTAGNLPTTTDLALGEVAINTKDGKFFIRKHVDGTDSGDAITMYAPQGLNTYGTQVLEVKVITKTTAHPQYGTGSASGYSIDGLESPFITLIPGNTYKFDQADSSNTGHPLRFYLEEDKTTSFTTGVTTSGTPGSASAYTQIVVDTDTPQVLYYQCSSHAYMGSGAYALSDAIADGKVGTDQLAANAVTSAKIAANAITSSELAADSVGSSEIAANAVGSTEIAANAVSTSEIASNAITTALIAENAVSTSEIASNAITSALIAANAIGSSELASSGVTAASYGSSSAVPVITVDADGRITSASTASISGLAANAVTATEIAANAVGSSEIASDAVDTAEIADNAVTSVKIASNAVTSSEIAANAITSSEIASNSVGIDELNVSDGTSGQVLTTDGSGTLSFSTVSSSSQNLFETIAVSGQSDIVADSTTDTLTFAAGSGISLTTNASTDTLTITATGGGLSANAVTSAYIASNAVLARHIAANAVGSSELASTAVTAGSYTNADITVDADGRITSASSGSATIADNSITSAKIAANAVGSSELAASGVTSGTYGSATASPQLTVDADGRITSVSNVTISSSGGGGGVGLNQTISQYSASGDGSTLAFNTSITLTDENLTWVFIDGVYQQKDVYSVSGTTVTFGSGNAPPNGSTVEVMVLESITTGGAFGHNSFNGDGSTATFTLGQTPTAETDLIAFIDGVYQNQDSFTISGADITFDTAPANGTKVIVYVIGGVVTGKVQIVNNFSGDASTTDFTLTINPVSEENTNVYIDGVYQQKTEYSVSGTTLTFSSAPPSGTNNIEVVIGQVTTTTSMGANSVTSAAIAASAVGTSELAANAVTTAKIASNSVTSALIAANAVGSSEIAANAVTATQIGSNAVTATHIAIGAVGSAEIAANAVSSSELASDALSGQNFTGDVTFDTNVLFVDSVNNRIGIGTASNTRAKVEIEDGGTTDSVLLRISADDNQPYSLIVGNDTYSTTASDGFMSYVTDVGLGIIGMKGTSSELDIRTVNTSAIYIDSSQKIGLRNSSPSKNLHIKSTVAEDTGIIIENTNNGQNLDIDFWNNVGSVQARIRHEESSGHIKLFPNASTTAAITATYAGDVGIGTETPDGSIKLDVRGNVRIGDGSTVEQDINFQSANGSWQVGSNDSGGGTSGNQFYIYDTNLTAYSFTVQRGGGVGIGYNVTSPATTLEVSNTTSSQKLLGLFESQSAGRAVALGVTETGVGGQAAIYGTDTNGSSTTQSLYINPDGGYVILGKKPAAGVDATVTADGNANATTFRMSYDYGNATLGNRGAHLDFQIGNNSGSATKITTNYWPGGSGDVNITAYGRTSPQLYLKASTTDKVDCLGIGTSSPNAQLHIDATGTHNNSGDAHVNISKNSSNDWSLALNAGNDDYGLITAGYGNNALYVYDYSASAAKFRVSYTGVIYAANTTVQSISDERLKENIVDANSQWNDIKGLRFRNFNWVDNKYGDKTYLGLIAQEVEPICPNLVEIDAQPKKDIDEGVPDPEYKTVNYSIVWMKSVKALQEAMERIEQLEAEVAILKGE